MEKVCELQNCNCATKKDLDKIETIWITTGLNPDGKKYVKYRIAILQQQRKIDNFNHNWSELG